MFSVENIVLVDDFEISRSNNYSATMINPQPLSFLSILTRSCHSSSRWASVQRRYVTLAWFLPGALCVAARCASLSLLSHSEISALFACLTPLSTVKTTSSPPLSFPFVRNREAENQPRPHPTYMLAVPLFLSLYRLSEMLGCMNLARLPALGNGIRVSHRFTNHD